MSPDEILAAFQRNVRRLDNWRGYIGNDEDSPTDDEVHEVLQQARVEIAGPRGGARIAEQLYLRVAELERQRDAVLALHQPVPSGYRWIGSIDNPANRVPHNECSSCYSPGSFDDYDTACRDTWPCPTAAVYGGGE